MRVWAESICGTIWLLEIIFISILLPSKFSTCRVSVANHRARQRGTRGALTTRGSKLRLASSGHTRRDGCSFLSSFKIPVKFPPSTAVNNQKHKSLDLEVCSCGVFMVSRSHPSTVNLLANQCLARCCVTTTCQRQLGWPLMEEGTKMVTLGSA